MTIVEMHNLFRTIGQAKGIQLVRGILPEEIDSYLNLAISDKCRSILITNVNTQFKDKVSVRDNSIGVVNALRTLYSVDDITIDSSTKMDDYYKVSFQTSNVMLFTSFSVDYAKTKNIKVRLIDNDKLESVLQDFCNGASWDNPIVVLFKDYVKLFVNSTSKSPIKLHIRYIANPAIVSYKNNIDCDLPSYEHTEIVEFAVNKFFNSVGSTSNSINNN